MNFFQSTFFDDTFDTLEYEKIVRSLDWYEIFRIFFIISTMKIDLGDLYNIYLHVI
jgi:hypothetical protein